MVFFSVLYNPGENAIHNIALAAHNGFKPIVYLNNVDENFYHRLLAYDPVILGSNLNNSLQNAFLASPEPFLVSHCCTIKKAVFPHLLFREKFRIIVL